MNLVERFCWIFVPFDGEMEGDDERLLVEEDGSKASNGWYDM